MTTLATTKSTHLQTGGDPGYARALIALVAWFFFTIWLGLSGALGSTGKPPVGLAAAIGIPLLVFALDARVGGPLSRAFARIDLATLTALQTFRVAGAFFLIAWSEGTLPGAFALPAGIGDIAVGLAAPLVATAVAGRKRGHLTLAFIFNLAGIVDLVLAVSEGVTHSNSALGFLAGPVTTDRLGHYPFSLIPTFFVPLALILHGFSLRAIARGRRDGASA
ncbi:MAG TPA: hypothetical protein VGP64_15795 [Polyangia bacterium]|jgi:hypothetical protein